MNRMTLACMGGVLAALVAISTRAELAPTIPRPISAAVGDDSRPASDRARDADRKPAAPLAFAGVKPGDVVADYAAGSGYFTRLFADVVGPSGHVYAVVPSALFEYPNIFKGIADIEN